ncbi:MAG: ABC transporter substrate-binding protein [Limnochordales bacterium]
MKRWTTWLVATTVFLAFSLGAAAQPMVMEAPTIGQYGGELSVATISDPRTFNPYLARETSSTDIIEPYIFESLITRNGVTTAHEPMLARDWEFSEDGLTLTVYLREGVYWHDGVEFTADDVVFSFDLAYDPNIPNNFRDGLLFPEPLQYRAIDKYTVEFKLPVRLATILDRIAIPIVPKHILEQPWREGRFNEMWGVDTPPWEIIGTGPFQMLEYRPNERVVLVRYPNYWRVDAEGNRLPYVSRLVFHIVGNQDAARLLFDNGVTNLYAVRGQEVDEMMDNAARGNYTVYNGGPTFSTLFLVFNQNELFVPSPKVDWFQNVHFRRAVAHALDRQSIIDIVFGGHAVEQWSPVSAPNRQFLKTDVRTYPYDLEAARRELIAGGFTWGRDGKLYDANGNHVEFNLATNQGNLQRETMATLLVEDLTALGMTVHYNPLDFNLLVNQLTSGEGWDAIIIGLTGSIDPDAGSNVWQYDGGLHMWNVGRDEPQTEWEARIHEIFMVGRTILDPEERVRVYYEWQDLVAEYLPLIYGPTPVAFAAARNNIRNIEYTAYGGLLHNVYVLWIE